MLAMKEAMVCSNMMVELAFKKRFSSVPLYLDNTSTLYADGNRAYSLREEHIALRCFFVHALVEEGKITIHNVNTPEQTWVPNIGAGIVTVPSSNSSTTSRPGP